MITRRERLRPVDWQWLPRSAGFSACTHNGRLGTVFGVRVDPGTGELVAVRVRTGFLRQHTVEVPVTAVIAVEPRRRRVYVRDEEVLRDT